MDHSVRVEQFAEARANEIASLMEDVACKKNKNLIQRLPHHMRRRAASQDPRRVPRKLRTQVTLKPKQSSKGKKQYKGMPRNLQVEYASRNRPDAQWLETHIWHAKRFKMDTLWNYKIPIHCHDKKLGATHRAAAFHTMIIDMSYFCCIELSGFQNQLLIKLSDLTDNLSGFTFEKKMYLDGALEGQTMLYKPKHFPYGAIGPVSFLWRPVASDTSYLEYYKTVPGNTFRHLWIWCHPSCHEELVSVLVSIFGLESLGKEDSISSEEVPFVCKGNHIKTKHSFKKEKIYKNGEITMTLLKNTLSRHRLLGPTALSVLTKALHVADIVCPTVSESEPVCSKKIKLESPISSNECAVSQDVLWWEKYYGNQHHNAAHSDKRDIFSYLKESKYFVPPKSVIGCTIKDPRMNLSWRTRNNGIKEEEEVSQHFLLSKFDARIADSPLWEKAIRDDVTATKISESEIHSHRAKHIVTTSMGRKENRIPILISYQSGVAVNGFGSGWDIIAPLGWSAELWKSYERNGGRAVGLRDQHFVNMEAGQLTFPCSFPDTKSGYQYEEKTRLDRLLKHCKQPTNKRPNFDSLGVTCPFFICWKTLLLDWEVESEKDGLLNNKNSSFLSPVPSKDTIQNGCTSLDFTASSSQNGVSSDGSVLECHNFYVMKNTKLRDLCTWLNKRHVHELSEDDFERASSFLRNQIDFKKSLLSVRVNCVNRGKISTHSGIYLLSDSDFNNVKLNPKFFGPDEPNHKFSSVSDNNSNQKFKIKYIHKSKKLSDAERPQVKTLISNMSRKLIGYISEGGYSSITGHSCGLGHCSTLGFLELLKRCFEAKVRPLALVKEQNVFPFRVASIEIVEPFYI